MTTQSWSTPIDHSSDAGFRTGGAELKSKFLAAGLVQAPDTGQIDWTTVTRAAANTDAGYEIYYLNDSLFGTAPIYLKIFYGTGSTTSLPRLRLQIGTGTNGAGTLTGLTNTALQISMTSGALSSTTNSYQSFLCVTAGFIGLIWKAGNVQGVTGVAVGGFCLCRSCDSSGAISATGAFMYACSVQNSTSAVATNQSMRFASTAIAYASTTNHAASVPGAETSSTIGTDTQAFLFWMLTKQVAPVFGMAVAYLTEISEASTFSATLVGTTSHTYIQTARRLGTGWNADNNALQGMCMLWE